MSNSDDRSFDDVEASPAPEHVSYPAVPLAYHTSPHLGPVEWSDTPAPVGPAAERSVPDEPWGLLDLEEPPETYGIDEMALLARDPWTLFCWWEATSSSVAIARAQVGGQGALVLRLLVSSPDAPPQTLDVDLGWHHGRRYLGAPRSGATVISAIGVRASDGRFAVIARAPRCTVPPGAPTEGPVEWMEVAPARSRGAHRELLAIVQHGSADEVRGASAVTGLPVQRGAGLAAGPGPRTTSGAPTSPSSPAGSSSPSSPARSAR